MEEQRKTLVIMLCMHRSGSSASTRILHRLGMSLGPYELLGAHPSNPHGHFESLPFLHLNRKVQHIAHGFIDEMPESQGDLEAFLASQGTWSDQTKVPEELVEEGRSLVAALLDSAPIAGFKDPRTVLIWPFWRQVLEAFPDLIVVPVMLLRSPHEIAMSLFDRRGGRFGYWACLDLVAIHMRRAGAIVAGWDDPVPTVRFGTSTFLDDMAAAATHCGLTWNQELAEDALDRSCIHQVPAVVRHEAQDLFLSFSRQSTGPDAQTNEARLDTDARYRDTLSSDHLCRLDSEFAALSSQLQSCRAELQVTRALHDQAQAEIAALRIAQGQFEQAQNELMVAHGRIQQSENQLQSINARLEYTESEFRAVRSQFEQSESEFRAVRGQFEQSESELRAVRGQFEQSESELRAVRGQFEQSESEVTGLRSRLGQSESELAAARCQLVHIEKLSRMLEHEYTRPVANAIALQFGRRLAQFGRRNRATLAPAGSLRERLGRKFMRAQRVARGKVG